MFRLNRNERSYWSGNGVHVESELVFMIGRNMHHYYRKNIRIPLITKSIVTLFRRYKVKCMFLKVFYCWQHHYLGL